MAQPDPLVEEAADPSTDPARLRELAYDRDDAVRRAARKNPSVSEDVWRRALFLGEPEAWSNPMAPIYFLTWTPRQGETISLEGAAQLGAHALWREPERYSTNGKTLLAAKLEEWWATSTSASTMIGFLGEWAEEHGEASPEHKEVVRILLCCVQTVPNLTDKDREAIDLLKSWSEGGTDDREEAKVMNTSNPVRLACRFAWNHQYTPWQSIQSVVEICSGYDPKESARLPQERRLADLIRQEMPVPATLPARSENPEEIEQPADLFEAIAWANDGVLSPEEVAELRAKIQEYPKVKVLGDPLENIFLVDWKVVTLEDEEISVRSPSEWVSDQMDWGLGKHIKDDVEAVVAERFNEEFQTYPNMLWHATEKKNIPSILKKGLRAEDRTRGLTNKGVGAAIFASDNQEVLMSGVYGDVILEIDCKAMKRDGVEFSVAQEPSVVEMEVAGVLASAVEADDLGWEVMSDGADDPSTVILHIDRVPPKYLRVVDED